MLSTSKQQHFRLVKFSKTILEHKNINCKKNIIHVTTILGRFWKGIGVLSLDENFKSKKKHRKLKNLLKKRNPKYNKP